MTEVSNFIREQCSAPRGPRLRIVTIRTGDQIDIDRLATDFRAVVQDYLSDEELFEIDRRNEQNIASCICASHDFCDANMAMDMALARQLGDDYADRYCEGLDDDEIPTFCELFGYWWGIAIHEAWSRVKCEGFSKGILQVAHAVRRSEEEA